MILDGADSESVCGLAVTATLHGLECERKEIGRRILRSSSKDELTSLKQALEARGPACRPASPSARPSACLVSPSLATSNLALSDPWCGVHVLELLLSVARRDGLATYLATNSSLRRCVAPPFDATSSAGGNSTAWKMCERSRGDAGYYYHYYYYYYYY